jgi:cyanophycinase
VAIVPTASQPDGEAVFARWLAMGVEHFARLGARAEPVALRTRADAEDPALAETLGRADFVYLSGGKPAYLGDVLRGTACWAAIASVYSRGGVIAGCSAGAMVLGESMFDFRRGLSLSPALGLVPNLAIIPHFDEIPLRIGDLVGRVTACTASSNLVVAGIDGATALVGSGGEWKVAGRGVTVFAGRTQTRYFDGQAVRLTSG